MNKWKVTDRQQFRIAQLEATIERGDLRTIESVTPEEVAALFKVHHVTVLRWIEEGKLPEGSVFRTLGGHRRIFRVYLEIMLENDGIEADVIKGLIDTAIKDVKEAHRHQRMAS